MSNLFRDLTDALHAAGYERVFQDHASGDAVNQPNLAACLDYLRRSNVLVVLELDRLGHLASELITLIDVLSDGNHPGGPRRTAECGALGRYPYSGHKRRSCHRMP